MWYVIILICMIAVVLFICRSNPIIEEFKKQKKLKKLGKKRKKRRQQVDEEAIARTLIPKIINPSEEFFRVAFPNTDVRPVFNRTPTIQQSKFTGRATVFMPKIAFFDNHESMLLQHMSCMSIPQDKFDLQQMTNAPFLNFRLLGSNTQTIVEQALGIIKALASQETAKVVAQSKKTDDLDERPPQNKEPTGISYVNMSEASSRARFRSAKKSGDQTSILLNKVPLYPSIDNLPQAVTAANDNTQAGSGDALEPLDDFQAGLVSAGIGNKYDFVADYKQRLRELLRLLNLLHQEAFLMNQFLPRDPKEEGIEDDGNEEVVHDPQFETPSSTSSQSDSMFQTWKSDVKASRNKVVGESKVVITTKGTVQGPIYLFLANHTSATVEGYLYFPSITKDGRPAPNLDFLGRSHRWMHRLMFGRMYYEESSVVGTCNLPCFGLPKFRDVRSGHDVTDYVVKCGCIGSAKKCKPKGTLRKKKSFDPPRSISFVAYKFNPLHPHISPMMDLLAPQDLRLNILPANTFMYHGCGSQLISPNMQYYLRLDRHYLTLYENIHQHDLVKTCPKVFPAKEGKPLLTVAFPRIAVYLSVDDGQLRVATTKPYYRNMIELINEEEVEDTWTYTVSDERQDPLTLVLMDDGSMRVYNSSDQDVTIARFKDVYNTSREIPKDANFTPDEDALLIAARRKWQSDNNGNDEYSWRVEHLRMWLMARRLYKDTLDYVNPDSISLQAVVGNVLHNSSVYDPSEDYGKRLAELITFIQNQGFWKEISDEQRVYDMDEDVKKKDAEYDTSVSYAQRVSELVEYLKKHRLWRETTIT